MAEEKGTIARLTEEERIGIWLILLTLTIIELIRFGIWWMN